MLRDLQSFLLFVVLIWTIIGLESSVKCSEYEHHVQVSIDGHDNTSCLTNYSFPCKTLGFVLEHLKNSTNVSIKSGHYILDRNYNTSNLENVAFIGLQSDSVRIQCSREVGLQFRFCNNIVFKQLLFEGCGRLEYLAPFQLNYTKPNYQFYSAISFTYCKDLDVENCTFMNSSGISLLLYDVGGNVNIIDSQFVNNTGEDQSSSWLDVHKTAGGILLHLTQFGSLYPFNDTRHHLYSDSNNYILKRCIFSENRYKLDNSSNSSQVTPLPFGHGAGLTALFCGSAKNNSLLIDTCHFYNNTGIWGGGIFTEFQNKAEGNILKILDSEFIGNGAEYGGGAVRTGNAINVKETDQLLENTVQHKRNTFQDNYAAMGGAVSHYGRTYLHILGKYKNSIHFEDCSFDRNIASLGSAISVALNNKNNWMEMGPEIPYCAVIANCKINNNRVDKTKVADQGHAIGAGVVYSSKVPLVLKGENLFQSNYYTAMLLDNAPLKVFDKTFFTKNAGNKGGALAMYGETQIIMTKGSEMVFTENHANETGGAIYIRAPGPEVDPFKTRELRRHECSIGYEDEKGNLINLANIQDWDTHINFSKNSAPLWGGNSVYSTTLQSCFLANESIGKNSAFAWENIIQFGTNTVHVDEEISTDPVSISVKQEEWSVAPGEVFNPTVQLLDERNSPVKGIVNLVVKNESSDYHALDVLFLIQSNKMGNSSVINGLKLPGRENSNFMITISIVGGQAISRSFRQKFQYCYPGFEQKSGDQFCSCMSSKDDMQEGVYNCSSDGKHVNLLTGYWGGRVRGKFVTYPCPPHYCYFDENKYFYSYSNFNICQGNRCSGVPLCGKCKENFTVSLGGENCVEISKCGKHFSISWGIPLFIVLTPLVVLVLLRINVDIFTSYLNSWLYFYQVLPFVLKPETVMKLDTCMKGILDLVSWRLPGVELSCFVEKLDNIGKLGLNYSLPLYMLVILIVIILVARCSCNCYQRTNVFRAISSILVLCYTNLLLISFNAIRWVKLRKNFWVLYIEGSITNDKIPPGYYVLLVFAVIVIVCFVVVFPLLLVLRPFFIRNIRFTNYFTPLYNIFQHCFQDHLGCFSAYYFICRIALLILTAALATPGPYQRCFTEILVFLTLVVFVYVQPYKTDSHLKWLNTVDTVILSFLCLLAFLSSAQNSEAAIKTIRGTHICIEILAWLPMLYLVGLIMIAIKYYYISPSGPRHGYQDLDDPTSTTGT